MGKAAYFRAVGAAAIAASFLCASAHAQDLVIGTSVPLAGPLAQAGAVIRDGYQIAVDEINAKGGVTINGAAHKIKLIVLDNQGDPNQVAGQVRKLVQKEKAVALLGAATPVFNGPISAAADQLKIPVVMSLAPIDAWQNQRKGGYKFAWNIYVHEPDATVVTWKTADLTKTNKKVALFLNTDEDGGIWGDNWIQQAKDAGYEIVYVAKMPVGTSNFSDYINAAKSAGAEIALGQVGPPDGIALWKQMKALGYSPKIASCEKCGSGDWWPGALGPIAEGTLTSDIYDRGLGGPQAEAVIKALGDKYKGKVFTAAVTSHTVVNVLADAIERAQSTDPDAINAELAKTDKTYSIGHVKFTAGHGAPVAPIMLQWQHGQVVRVYPTGAGSAPLEAPMPGLQ